MKLENLKTVRNYSLMVGMTAANIYRMIKLKQIDYVTIDGVIFIKIDDKDGK